MARSTSFSPWVNFALLLNRVALGLYFAIAGFNKIKPSLTTTVAGNLKTFAERIADDAPLPRVMGLGLGYAIPFLEMIVGVMLLIGLLTRQTASVIACMILIGASGLSDGTSPFHANVIFFTLAVLLAATGPGSVSFDWLMGGRRGRR